MVERIQNGDFSLDTGGTDRDPLFWTVSENTQRQVTAGDDGFGHERLVFNRGSTASGSSVEQDIPNISIGKQIDFSLNYFENGSGGDPSVLVEVLDGNGVVIFSQTASIPGTTVSHSFVSVTTSYTVRITDTSTGNIASHDAHVDDVSFTVACFAGGNIIATPNGKVAVETIQVGQLISTLNNEEQPVRWIRCSKLDAVALAQNPNLLPILIPKDALGAGMPENDLIVSPQHRILLRSRIAQRMYGCDEILVAAKKLDGSLGVSVMKGVSEIEYYHLLLDRHEIVLSNGAASEPLFLGPMGLNALGKNAISELRNQFPKIDLSGEAPDQARSFGKGKKFDRLMARHMKDQIPLVESNGCQSQS